MRTFGKKTWVIGGVVAALLGTAAFAVQSHASKDRAGWMTDRITSQLDLDATQKDALSRVTDSYVQVRGTTPEFMLDLSDRLKELASDDTLTTEEVNQLRTEIKAEFDRRADILIPDFVAFYNTLNDEQRQQVVARLEKFTDRIEHRYEKRRN